MSPYGRSSLARHSEFFDCQPFHPPALANGSSSIDDLMYWFNDARFSIVIYSFVSYGKTHPQDNSPQE